MSNFWTFAIHLRFCKIISILHKHFVFSNIFSEIWEKRLVGMPRYNVDPPTPSWVNRRNKYRSGNCYLPDEVKSLRGWEWEDFIRSSFFGRLYESAKHKPIVLQNRFYKNTDYDVALRWSNFQPEVLACFKELFI